LFVLCSFFAVVCLLAYIANTKNALETENVLLKQQLEQALLQIGRPINVTDLPDGSYMRADDNKHFAFVQGMADFPVGACGSFFAVHCKEEEVPYVFAVKDIRKETENFLKKISPNQK